MDDNLKMNGEEQCDDLSCCRVLLAEDSLLNVKIATKVFEKLSIRAAFAPNGEECVRMVSESEYDIVFMDCQMPVMDGFEATRRIRELVNGKAIPIIAMTGATRDEEREMCYSAGMTDFVAKPVSHEAIRTAILKHCKKHL